MSIIYDALKKIENITTKDIKDNLSGPKRNKYKFAWIAVYTLIAIGLIVLISLRYSSYPISLIPSIPKATAVSSKRIIKPLDKELPHFSLTGIFFSDGQYLALINDRVVRVGDFIEEAQVVKIDSKGVRIKFRGSFFRLNYP